MADGLNRLRAFIIYTVSGVALPFRDLRQPTRNITYFASMARKMRTAKRTYKAKTDDGVTWLYLTGYKVSRSKTKKSLFVHQKKWKCLLNLPFTKSLHNSEHRTRYHFPRMNRSRRCRQTQFSSTAEFCNEMKLKSRLPPFFLTRIWVSTRVLFSVS